LRTKWQRGDIKSLALYIDLLRKIGQLDKAPTPREEVLSADDLQAAAELLRFCAPTDDAQSDEQGGAP
jgi:hypothetical protein